jgi:hypothetical protein
MNFPTSWSLPNDLAVVGEHKEDPEQLLLQDAEGNYYAYTLPSGDPEPVDPDEEWAVESAPLQELFI